MGLRTWFGLNANKFDTSMAAERRVPIKDYETYKRTQNEGNARKLHWVSAREPNIHFLAKIASRRLGPNPRILCHGTRNGGELRFFKAALPGCTILGTDIADSASTFPDTIQWDFHDLKDEWVGAWDVIYSNSWDHAFDPERAFSNWMKCLAPHGLLFLEHTREHTPAMASDLDPFGAERQVVVDLVNRVGAPQWRVVDVITKLPDRRRRDSVIVVGRTDS